MINHRKIPKILYKFRTWEDPCQEIQYGRRLLTENEVYFASVDQFNDPFDGSLPFRYKREELTSDNIFKKLFEVFAKMHPDKSATEIHQLCWERQQSGDFDSDFYWQNFHPYFIQKFRETFGVLSLASMCNNILMWSHYADSHKGYCIGLDSDILFECCRAQIGKVHYANKFPFIPLFDESPNGLIGLTVTKSKKWKYEREVRVVNTSPRQTVKLPEEAFLRIVLGCRMPESHKKAIYALLANKFSKSKVFETQINNRQFQLDFLPILKGPTSPGHL